MEIEFNITYETKWGEMLYVCGSLPELGEWDENKAFKLNCYDYIKWVGRLSLNTQKKIEYYYIVKENDIVIRREWGKLRILSVESDRIYYLADYWRDVPQQRFLYTSPFTESFFYHKKNNKINYFLKTIHFKVDCPFVEQGQSLVMCGESDLLGNWTSTKASKLRLSSSNFWEISIDASLITVPLEFKFAIYDERSKQITHWEEGANRLLHPFSDDVKYKSVKVFNIKYNHPKINWKSSGVAIPVFSLRTKDSFGIGEFSDLMKMVDWAVKTGMKIIQILPINDTTISRKWTDSYPYNAISIYALHPLYLGLKKFPLKDKKKNRDYIKEGEALNMLPSLDYEKVLALKTAYFKDLFNETGEDILASTGYKSFYKKNKKWLFPYACFSFLRDKYNTADFSRWEEFHCYDKRKLEKMFSNDLEMSCSVYLSYFIQYLLHCQLIDARNYAHSKGVVLKGDIPIGINRESVEAWTDPHLFNMDGQTGAPPDNFSKRGQNWGFPTYNWNEMSKDNYQWWRKRFQKMTDYFDAYRIDHILGFFRIWEIPRDSVFGLLGTFNPALPFSEDELRSFGFFFDKAMTKPFINESVLDFYFGENKNEVVDTYLLQADKYFELKCFCDTQLKIKELFQDKTDSKSLKIKNGLYSLCEEVLFLVDKNDSTKFHPRISAQYTQSYESLDENQKDAFNKLYDYFFYYRHDQYWKEQALKKLPVLIDSTDMLVCGEDLGMIPNCVPDVMRQLEILSLEIQRMPKTDDVRFENLEELPYNSVCTTSTHDMSPIRLWWSEDVESTQYYFNQVLKYSGLAPKDCSVDICRKILDIHLKSSSMLVILPLQDWLSIDDKLKNSKPDEERINIPAESLHYWKYRMHLNIEDLLNSKDFNASVFMWLKEVGR